MSVKGWIIGVLVLCPLVSHAELIEHNFDPLYKSGAMVVSNNNKLGTVHTDTTYTCSGGTAQFTAVSSIIVLRLKDSGAQVVEAPAIMDLDSLSILYTPGAGASAIVFYVDISTDNGVSWSNIDVVYDQIINGTTGIKLPEKGNYCVRVRRAGKDIDILKIKYFTRPCHCVQITSE